MRASPQMDASPQEGRKGSASSQVVSLGFPCNTVLSTGAQSPSPPTTSPPLKFESHQDALKLGLIFINYKLVGSGVVPNGAARESQLAWMGMLRGVTNPHSG